MLSSGASRPSLVHAGLVGTPPPVAVPVRSTAAPTAFSWPPEPLAVPADERAQRRPPPRRLSPAPRSEPPRLELCNAWGQGSKRPYCADMHGMWHFLTPRAMATTLCQRGVLASLPALQEWTKYQQACLDAEEAGKPLPPDLDTERMLGHTGERFVELSFKAILQNACRAQYEHLALAFLPLRTADRLTKNVLKSAQRKLAREPGAAAARRLFRTALWGNATLFLAIFTVEAGYTVWMACRRRPRPASVPEMLRLAGRLGAVVGRTGWALLLTYVANCAGAAMGCYLVGSKFGVSCCQLLLETLVGAAFPISAAVALGD